MQVIFRGTTLDILGSSLSAVLPILDAQSNDQHTLFAQRVIAARKKLEESSSIKAIDIPGAKVAIECEDIKAIMGRLDVFRSKGLTKENDLQKEFMYNLYMARLQYLTGV